MKKPTAGEYSALLVATLVLIITLISCFMCIQLYHLRKPAPAACNPCPGRSRGEGFLGSFYYSPACGSEWMGRRRRDCRGATTGIMPSIETTGMAEDRPCCGVLGVPPL
jgi:hypothetical protein